MRPGDPGDFRVLVAGGGVAGLEAVLALRELSPSIAIEMLTPGDSFSLVQLSVAEPFGARAPASVSIEEFCAEQRVELTRGELSEVWARERRVLTDGGDELPYDALLLCSGTRRRSPLEGALCFGGPSQAQELGELVESARSSGGDLLLEVPAGTCWPLPLYELALLIADRLSGSDSRVRLRTPESAPLELLGADGSRQLAAALADAGVALEAGFSRTARGPVPEAGGALVTIPTLDVREIPGLNQGAGGFVLTDARMRAAGVDDVWCAGDVTWFPVKQGGIATQQADVAAAEIARHAGIDVEQRPFAPILRVALMTADGIHYLRVGGSRHEHEEEDAPLWWPPAKVAGRLLAPYLAHRADPAIGAGPLTDLEPGPDRAANHAEALELALAGADADAAAGEFDRALHWLDIAEELEIVLPAGYRERRTEWERLAGVGRPERGA